MRREDRLGRVVELLYDAALEDANWAAVASAVADAFGSPSAVLKTYDRELNPQLESATDNLRIGTREQSWAEHWHRHDLWVERSSLLDKGDVFTSQRLIPDAQFERTGFHQDWTRRLDIYHMVGVLFPGSNGGVGVLGVHRPRASGAYGEADCRQLKALFPHVQRALGLRLRFRDAALAQNAALDALDRIDTGVLVVDESGWVLYASRAAEQLLRSERDIRASGGRFRIDDPGLNDRLARLIREAVQTAGGKAQLPGAALAIPRVGRLPVTLLVSPWRAAWTPLDVGRPAAMIFLRDPERSESASAQTLRELFGLTRAEAAIALAIGQGQSLEQIAALSGVGIGTVRTHLKRALTKTDTHRQATLAALVARSVAGISPAR